MKYEEIFEEISYIKKSIIDLQDNITDDTIYNYLEEANSQLRECKEYVNDKIFEDFCKEEDKNANNL